MFTTSCTDCKCGLGRLHVTAAVTDQGLTITFGAIPCSTVLITSIGLAVKDPCLNLMSAEVPSTLRTNMLYCSAPLVYQLTAESVL